MRIYGKGDFLELPGHSLLLLQDFLNNLWDYFLPKPPKICESPCQLLDAEYQKCTEDVDILLE